MKLEKVEEIIHVSQDLVSLETPVGEEGSVFGDFIEQAGQTGTDDLATQGTLRDEEERRARGVSAREVVESQRGNYSPRVRGALEGIVARDEMGPRVGQEPPDFFLKRMGSDEKVRLSSFKGRRPVALVFGSYT